MEPGVTPLQAARRELYEETGITDCEISPLWEHEQPWDDGIHKSNGQVYLVIAHYLSNLLVSETGKIELFESVPKNFMYERSETVKAYEC